jgi:hypothetical protein
VTIESAQITRWAVLAALSLATAVMIAVSIRGNYLFGYGLGQTPEKRELFAWANVAADVWKAFGLLAVSMLWRNKHRRAASFASLAWFACLLFGVNSALGVYVQDRAALTGTREAKHATYKDAEKELAVLEERLRILVQHRSVGEVEAAINAALGQAIISGERVRGTIGGISQQCTKVDARTVEACKGVAQLREEHTVATEATRLEVHARKLREQVATLREHGGSVAPDPVGEFYAWITRGAVSVRDVGFGFPLFFALLIEVVSAFGPMTIAAYAEASRSGVGGSDIDVRDDHDATWHVATRRDTTRSVGLAERETGSVVNWIAERGAPASDNNAIGIEELHADYVRWCGECGQRAASISLFEEDLDRVRSMPELAGKIRKFGDRYYGIELLPSGTRALGSRRSG